jgi:hypothetical protein
MHADLACTIARAALPEVAQAQARHLAGQLDPEPAPATPPAVPTETAGERPSEGPAPTVAAGGPSQPAADAVRLQTGETASPPPKPTVAAVVARQQTAETGWGPLTTPAALPGPSEATGDEPQRQSGASGPLANGENAPANRRGAHRGPGSYGPSLPDSR